MASRKTKKPSKGMLLTACSGALSLLLLLPAGDAQAGGSPEPEQLLDAALSVPEVAYQGRMMVTHWYGKQTKAEDVEVYHSPPNLSRKEFLAPDGSVARVVISDGEREEVHLVKQKKVLQGDAVKSYSKLMSPEKERELLLKNYQPSVVKSEKVAGRNAWVLELKPLVAGKQHQRLWVDSETRVVLENKRFLPHRPFAAQARFIRFEPKKSLDESLFKLELDSASAATGTAEGLEPDFMTLQELNAATGKAANFPAELPAGFVFESADYFEVGKDVVRHARYTDGLAILSLFATDHPVRLPKGDDLAVRVPSKGPGTLRLSSSGKVLSWRRGRQYFTLMGDVSRELLQTISARLK